MRDPVISWPHAPVHQLFETGIYFVTAGTYFKAHHFRTRDRLDVLHRGLLKVAQDFAWQLEAWAVFSNHYHFVGRSPEDAEESTSLAKMLTVLHRRTAIWLNRLDKTPGRKIWHNFWDTKAHVSEIVPRPAKLRVPEPRKTWTRAGRESVPMVLGGVV